MISVLKINNLCVCVDKSEIIKNLSIDVFDGQVHAIMGPNGSGKSSLAYSLMGHPRFCVKSGGISFFNEDVVQLSPDERAKRGLFLAFQYPKEIPGATVFSVLKESLGAVSGKLVSFDGFSKILFNKMDILKIDHSFAYRNLNEDFSGGEKKRFEILQMLVLRPRLAILDEIDSGLDIDSLKVVAKGIKYAKKENPRMTIIIITHRQHILRYIKPDFVHIMHDGTIVNSGNFELAAQIEKKGYTGFIDAKS